MKPRIDNANNFSQPMKIEGISGINRRDAADSRTSDFVHDGFGSSYNGLRLYDVLPLHTAKERFLQIFVDHFIVQHVVQVPGSEASKSAGHGKDKSCKRKLGEVGFDGDSGRLLPLNCVVNIYEDLVNQVNIRIGFLHFPRGATIRADLEAAGGLYSKLANKFPETGPVTFKRRVLATFDEARTKFPELVIQLEKGVRFMVVSGLEMVETPRTMSLADADWFKRLTGRSEVSISSLRYKVYSSLHKNQSVVSKPLASITVLPGKPNAQPAVGSSLLEESSQSQGTSTSPSSSGESESCSAKIASKPYVEPPTIPARLHRNPFLKEPYVGEIPSFMIPFVDNFRDYSAIAHRGHSGFQAIADGIEYPENGWRWVRIDLFKELESHADVYSPLFPINTVEKTLKALAAWTLFVPLDRQFSYPEMGHIVATCYRQVFVVVGQHECITFLPLDVNEDVDMKDMQELCLVSLFQGKKIISVKMVEEFPLPPIHPLWAHHHQKSVVGLDRRYSKRFEQYEWFQSFMGPEKL